jgi:hypothetical protein
MPTLPDLENVKLQGELHATKQKYFPILEILSHYGNTL